MWTKKPMWRLYEPDSLHIWSKSETRVTPEKLLWVVSSKTEKLQIFWVDSPKPWNIVPLELKSTARISPREHNGKMLQLDAVIYQCTKAAYYKVVYYRSANVISLLGANTNTRQQSQHCRDYCSRPQGSIYKELSMQIQLQVQRFYEQETQKIGGNKQNNVRFSSYLCQWKSI